MILLFVSFAAGTLTVLAPCILPLLPVIVGGSLTGEGKDAHKKKVLTIVVALGLSVMVFTLLLKVSTLFIAVPEYVWKLISGGTIILLGLVTVFPSLWEAFSWSACGGKESAYCSRKSLPLQYRRHAPPAQARPHFRLG